ncbi:integrase, catalytic region, zinc finger, CCHC-type containing protein [Tanacetum coccineum]
MAGSQCNKFIGIQDDRVRVQQVQGRQGQNYSSNTYKSNATSSRGNTTSGHARVVKCYNCQGEGHMARKCTQPKRPRNAAWYKEKAVLAEAQEAGQILDEEELTFLTDPGIPTDQAQTIIPHNVPNSETYLNDMDNQSMHALQDFEQSPVMDFTDNEISIFKNESKEKENKYMENEIDLEKKIKELDNIVYKVGQSAQTVHMLTKPQAFYDNTHKQALGYQNPFYLRKAQRIKPTLYDGAVISKTHVAMPVIDDEETLILEEESRSKMFEKAKDPEVIAKKISHKPIDYEKLNSLIEDFETRFSPQQELSAEQAFWFHTFNPTIEPSYSPPVIVDVPSELPKVSLVNASLKKLKFHLTQFDSVVKKRTTPSALEEGEWGFEHTKAVFNNEIIPFLKSLKDIFNVFDKDLLNEITEVQTVFDQMEASVQQFSVDKKCLEIAKKEILLENDRLLQKVMSQDVLITVMNSMSLNNDSVNVKMQKCELCEKCLNLDAELSKSKQAYNDLLKNHSQLEKHCISLEVSMQLKQEVFQNDESCVNQNAVEIQEYFEINDLKARLQDKDMTISKLKDTIKSLKMNTKKKNVNHDKCDLEPINKELENSMELLVYLQDTCPNAMTPSTKKVAVTPMNNVKKVRFPEPFTSSSNIKQPPGNKNNDRISQTPSRNKNNKVEAQPRKVNKMNRVVKPVCNVDVKQSLSNANSDILCVTCDKSMFDGVHDKYLLDLVQNGNKRTKSAKKHKNQNIWKPMCHVFTKVGFKWKPTGRIVTIVGNPCPLTRITSTNVVPPKQTTSHSDEIQKPEIKVYSRKPKNVKNIGSSKIAKIVESKNANHSEPNQIWGSTTIDIPSSSSLVMTGLKCSTSNCGSKPTGNKKNDRISQPSRNMKNKVEAQPKKVNKKNRVVESIRDVDVKHSLLNANSEPICATCKKSMFDGVHDMCIVRFGNDYIARILGYGDYQLAKDGLTRGMPRLKFQKDHMCSRCALGKRKKSSHQPKAEDTNQEKLYLLHMDLCDLMSMEIINGKLTMASEQFSLRPELHFLTPVTSSSGLVPNLIPQQPCIPPPRDDCDRLFQLMFDEYFTPPSISVSLVQEALLLRELWF